MPLFRAKYFGGRLCWLVFVFVFQIGKRFVEFGAGFAFKRRIENKCSPKASGDAPATNGAVAPVAPVRSSVTIIICGRDTPDGTSEESNP
jgi:hypothetical protein